MVVVEWFSHQVVSDSCDPMDCSSPGSSVHGILQARVLEWVAISFSSGLPNSGIKPRSPAFQADSLRTEPPGHIIGFNKYLGTFKIVFCIVGTEGDQNIPPQDTPLWHKNYFKFKLIEKKQIQELLCPLLFCPKAGHKFPLLKVTKFPL